MLRLKNVSKNYYTDISSMHLRLIGVVDVNELMIVVDEVLGFTDF